MGPRASGERRRRASDARCVFGAWGRALAGGLALSLAACASGPAASVDTPYGEARAATSEQAEQLASMLRSAVPALREQLPGMLERTTDVWLEDFERYENLRGRPSVVGLATTSTGLVRIRADRLGRDADFVLAHELVHALLGPDWDPLPSIVTEGLCDALAAEIAPESAAPIRAARRLDAAFAWPRLGLELRLFDPTENARMAVPIPLGDQRAAPPLEFLELAGRGLHLSDQRGDEATLYAYGMLVAERILERRGLDDLHALCLRARDEGLEQVPAAWMLEAAGLDEDPATWRRALLADLDQELLAHQVRYISLPLAQWLVDTFRARYPEFDAEGFMEQGLPTVGWAGTDLHVALSTVPELSDRLSARWAARGPAQLRPGEGWWLRDEAGVHLTTLMGPSRDARGYTLSRLRLPSSAMESQSPDLSGGEIEALISFSRLGDVLTLNTSMPGGFAEFRLEVDGFIVADTRQPDSLERLLDDRGWVTLSVSLEAPLELPETVLFHPAANVIVSQRALGEPAWATLHFPLLIPRRE